MRKRLNIILPETTIRTIRRMAKRGERSRFIDRAVHYYVANRTAEALRAQVERAAVTGRFTVEDETRQRLDEPTPRGKAAARGG